MRKLPVLSGALVFLLCFGTVPRAQAPKAVKMTPTAYDDGKSCPNNCDSHVVFHNGHNGTLNAYELSSSRTAPKKCVQGQPCKICFSGDESNCLIATYRGAGPPRGKFDFTPAFYAEVCTKSDIPSALIPQCREANKTVKILKERINCFETPEHEQCKTLMTSAAKRKAADDVLYDECKALGEATFNAKHKNQPKLQRSNDCAYEKIATGKNSKGNTWRRLLDGACRPETYVGRDGLDCCSNNLYGVALVGRECMHFFPKK